MKYKLATISILVLAFLLKGIITLVLVADAMAVQALSAAKPADLILPIGGGTDVGRDVAAPPAMAVLPAVPTVARPHVSQSQPRAPRQCHALPFSDQQAALPQVNPNLLRSATQGASDISGLDAILVGFLFFGITATAVFRRGGRSHVHGIVPELIVPPG